MPRIYLDKPGSKDFEVEAPDYRAAAQQFFSQRPRSENCRIRAESINTSGWREFDATEFMDEATRAFLPLPPLPAGEATLESSPMAPIRGLASAFRVLAVLEFIGAAFSVALWISFWNERKLPPVVYAAAFAFVMAGIISGCLFLAIADALIYLRQIRDSLAQKDLTIGANRWPVADDQI